MNLPRISSTLLVLAASSCASQAKVARPVDVALRSGARSLQVLAGDELFAELDVRDGQPPTVLDLRAPGDRPVLRGFPLAPRPGETVDHPEQTGMFTAHGSVDGADHWYGDGRPTLTEHVLSVQPDGSARVDGRLEWPGPGGALACSERRTYTFRADESARTIDLVHVLTATGNGVTFGDVREGLVALRLADDFRLTGSTARGTAFNSEGDRDLDLWGHAARWIAYVAPVAGPNGDASEVTVCVFDHPSNPRHPTRWQARPYGLVAANPFGLSAFDGDPHERGTFVLDAYEGLELRHRVLVAAGALEPASIEARWSQFAGIEPNGSAPTDEEAGSAAGADTD